MRVEARRQFVLAMALEPCRLDQIAAQRGRRLLILAGGGERGRRESRRTGGSPAIIARGSGAVMPFVVRRNQLRL